MKRIKKDNGAISTLVLFTIFMFIVILLGVFYAINAKQKSQLEADLRIQDLYGADIKKADYLYDEYIAKASGDTQDIGMQKPTGITINEIHYNVIKVTATGRAGNESSVQGYQYSLDGANWSSTVPSGTSYTLTDLTHNTTYTIYARTVNNENLYSESVTISATTKFLVNKVNVPSTSHSKIVGEEVNWNQVVVPEGFKVAQGDNGSGETVKDGIVIEDSEGNQYVWVPVSNINHDGSNKIKINSPTEEGVEITLGRYTFSTSSPGNPTLAANSYQYANTYETPVTIQTYFQELTTSGDTTTAKELGTFIDSVNTNKGYYIARYEASYRTNGKAASKVSTSNSATLELTSTPASRSAGSLWNFVKQPAAAAACQNLYTTIKSDLMNSYAWDTAIVYIQAMGNTNYANANRGSNTTLKNTGTTGDQKCKIFDMAGNVVELTTEYSSGGPYAQSGHSVNRGGRFSYADVYTYCRYDLSPNEESRNASFRSILYL